MKIKHYPVEYTWKQLIQMPTYCRVDACRVLADGSAFLVAVVDESQPMDDVEIAMYVEDSDIHEPHGDPGKYLGTIQNPVDMFVYHVYDVKGE